MTGIKLNPGDRFYSINDLSYGKSVARRVGGAFDEIEWIEYPPTVGTHRVSKDGGKTWSDPESF